MYFIEHIHTTQKCPGPGKCIFLLKKEAVVAAAAEQPTEEKKNV